MKGGYVAAMPKHSCRGSLDRLQLLHPLAKKGEPDSWLQLADVSLDGLLLRADLRVPGLLQHPASKLDARRKLLSLLVEAVREIGELVVARHSFYTDGACFSSGYLERGNLAAPLCLLHGPQSSSKRGHEVRVNFDGWKDLLGRRRLGTSWSSSPLPLWLRLRLRLADNWFWLRLGFPGSPLDGRVSLHFYYLSKIKVADQ